MNKKWFVFLLVAAVAVAGVFAEKKAQYKVKSVTGKVTYEVSNDEWAPVTVGMFLDEGATVSTGLNSTLVVVLDGSTTTIKPMKKGKLGELIALASTKGSVKVGSKVTKSDITDDNEKTTTKGVSTASSRASEAKEDVEWDE